MELELYGEIYRLCVFIGEYAANKNTAVELYTEEGEPFATLTINVCDLPKGLACIDTNNFPQAIELIEKYNLGKFTNNTVTSGFCAYPVFKLNRDNLSKYEMAPEEIDLDEEE